MIKNQILSVYYFAPISYWASYLQGGKTLFETQEFYEKQSFRNRCYLYGPNGLLSLVIPTQHEGKRKYRDTRICHQISWRRQHQKSFESAYRSSPYFEFYEMDFVALFQREQKFLIDFNRKCMELLADILKISLSNSYTEQYEKEYSHMKDLRGSFPAKSQINSNRNFPRYEQVFSRKYGFLSDLSLLDLLFNQGPESFDYLKNLHL